MTFTPSTPTITFTPTSTPEDPLAISPKNVTSFMPVSAINTGSGELAISPELNFIAFWNPEDRKKAMKVDLWDLVSGNLIVILTGHEKNISTAAFSPTGRLLATGDEGGTMRLWDVPAGTELFVMVVNKTRVNDLEFSPGGRFLASVTSDNTIRLWNTTNGELLYALNFLEGQAEDSPVPLNVAFSPNGRMLAAGTNGAIAIWSTSDGSLLKTLGEGVTGWTVLCGFVEHGYRHGRAQFPRREE
jgi:WD40 repeat protein